MTYDRGALSAAGAALLDTLAAVHLRGHQNSYANRYTITVPGGHIVEVMIEKGDGNLFHLWCEEDKVPRLLSDPQYPKRYAASELWTKIGKDGEPSYGRHSALEKMDRLGNADLVRFTPTSIKEIGDIIDALFSASRLGSP